jgi:TatD DNase family protein
LKPSEPWIIHGFRQNGEIAKKLIDEGFYLSFGMQITKNNPKLNLVFSDLPDSSFFLETDDEESHKINLVYNSASIIRNITVENLTSIQNKNFGDCFKVTF